MSIDHIVEMFAAKNAETASLRRQLELRDNQIKQKDKEILELKEELRMSKCELSAERQHRAYSDACLENAWAKSKRQQEHINQLEAIPKPCTRLPGITMQALGVVCNQQKSLEIERLREVISEKDAEYDRLRYAVSDLMNKNSDEMTDSDEMSEEF